MTSKASSMVIRPNNSPFSFTTGITTRSYFSIFEATDSASSSTSTEIGSDWKISFINVSSEAYKKLFRDRVPLSLCSESTT